MRLLLVEKTGYVYFIQMENTGPIKIGFAKNPKKRLIEHQVSNPFDLNLLYFFPACAEDEKNLQRICRKSSVRGEWFWPTKHVMREIEEQKRIDKRDGWDMETADPVEDFVDERLSA